ncbi:hypothetical protein [Nitrosophilus alvini]|uniref:hypothetical protein n=1 Tax=Nitrosophilus alvini TaxID=2714855 RepID=UPI0019096AC2|nr:hypothetical protein [Nitrosophilus alvini]
MTNKNIDRKFEGKERRECRYIAPVVFLFLQTIFLYEISSILSLSWYWSEWNIIGKTVFIMGMIYFFYRFIVVIESRCFEKKDERVKTIRNR